jgi:hypothetical protein
MVRIIVKKTKPVISTNNEEFRNNTEIFVEKFIDLIKKTNDENYKTIIFQGFCHKSLMEKFYFNDLKFNNTITFTERLGAKALIETNNTITFTERMGANVAGNCIEKVDYTRRIYIALLYNIFINFLISLNDSNLNNFENIKILLELSIYIEDKIFSNIISIDDYILYNENGDFYKLYRINMNKFTKNLDIDSEVNDNYFITKLINVQKDKYLFINYELIKNICNLTSYDLCPKKSESIKELVNARINQKNNVKTSKTYICGKCKQRETIIKEVQLRSADEGANLSITWVSCQHHWIM